ncbi:Hypothetical predicted protein [Pelobates cultripes]|uniref:Uncharacterized protein n=1 Tax=Pelobates cultripes TaxID=61616 RepID=A0AAD1RLD4_PELCU|nr:Hypothetical predicted protein [Pelobates cultripes]
MLHELRSSMKPDFQSPVADIRREVHEEGTCMSVLEEKKDDLCLTNNGILVKVRKLKGEQKCLTDKLADLEDRSRRNNI